MQARLQVTRDTITPSLRRKIRAMNNRTPILKAMGRELTNITVEAFRDSSMRAGDWPPRKDDQPHNLLMKSGTLWKSFRVTETTNESVTVGTDRPYAQFHQLGTSKMPARPMLPFTPDGRMTRPALQRIEAVAWDHLRRKMGR